MQIPYILRKYVCVFKMMMREYGFDSSLVCAVTTVRMKVRVSAIVVLF